MLSIIVALALLMWCSKLLYLCSFKSQRQCLDYALGRGRISNQSRGEGVAPGLSRMQRRRGDLGMSFRQRNPTQTADTPRGRWFTREAAFQFLGTQIPSRPAHSYFADGTDINGRDIEPVLLLDTTGSSERRCGALSCVIQVANFVPPVLVQ